MIYVFLLNVTLFVMKEAVLARVICQSKRQVVRVRLTHNRVCPIIEPFANILCRNLLRVDERQEFGDDLSWRINAMIAKLLNRRGTHAGNIAHLKVQQGTVDKLDDSISPQRTF